MHKLFIIKQLVKFMIVIADIIVNFIQPMWHVTCLDLDSCNQLSNKNMNPIKRAKQAWHVECIKLMSSWNNSFSYLMTGKSKWQKIFNNHQYEIEEIIDTMSRLVLMNAKKLIFLQIQKISIEVKCVHVDFSVWSSFYQISSYNNSQVSLINNSLCFPICFLKLRC